MTIKKNTKVFLRMIFKIENLEAMPHSLKFLKRHITKFYPETATKPNSEYPLSLEANFWSENLLWVTYIYSRRKQRNHILFIYLFI